LPDRGGDGQGCYSDTCPSTHPFPKIFGSSCCTTAARDDCQFCADAPCDVYTAVDECADTSTNNCHVNADCTDLADGYQCKCKQGHTGNGTHCVDIDECATSPCFEFADCQNTQGGHTCTCKAGYTGNGTTCHGGSCPSEYAYPVGNTCCKTAVVTSSTKDALCQACSKPPCKQFQAVDECTKKTTNNCHQKAECKDLDNGFKCTCTSGYQGNGTHCGNLNECLTSLNDCDANADCADSEGSYTCTCVAGYSGNGKTCEKVGPQTGASDIIRQSNILLFLSMCLSTALFLNY